MDWSTVIMEMRDVASRMHNLSLRLRPAHKNKAEEVKNASTMLHSWADALLEEHSVDMP
jgi:hypothetical protein